MSLMDRFSNQQTNAKIIDKAMTQMTKTLVAGGYASKRRAEEIRERILAAPIERKVKVNIKNKKEIEAFVLETIPEWSEEWLLQE